MRGREAVGRARVDLELCDPEEPGINQRVLDDADDLEVLAITIPAELATVTVAP